MLPADNDDGPHFGHHPSQAGHDARHDAVAGLPDDGEDFLEGRGPQGDGGLADHRVHPAMAAWDRDATMGKARMAWATTMAVGV